MRNGEDGVVRRKLQWIISLVISFAYKKYNINQNQECLVILSQKQEKTELILGFPELLIDHSVRRWEIPFFSAEI